MPNIAALPFSMAPGKSITLTPNFTPTGITFNNPSTSYIYVAQVHGYVPPLVVGYGMACNVSPPLININANAAPPQGGKIPTIMPGTTITGVVTSDPNFVPVPGVPLSTSTFSIYTIQTFQVSSTLSGNTTYNLGPLYPTQGIMSININAPTSSLPVMDIFLTELSTGNVLYIATSIVGTSAFLSQIVFPGLVTLGPFLYNGGEVDCKIATAGTEQFNISIQIVYN